MQNTSAPQADGRQNESAKMGGIRVEQNDIEGAVVETVESRDIAFTK